MSKPSKSNAAAPSGQANVTLTIAHYTDKNGHDYFDEWVSGLRDNKAERAIERRLYRASTGNFGLCGSLRDGVWELKIDVGPGYRVYYAKDGLTIVLLLCGGDKRKQSSDIDRACGFWREWQERKNRHKKKEGGK